MTDRLIRIKDYEQATEKVSIGAITWSRKWDVCIQCDSREEAEALRARLAQPDSATHSADSAESFCNQEIYDLTSLGGRLALELECLLLDTKDIAVVSRWWATSMVALEAWRNHLWGVSHGEPVAQPEQEPPCKTGSQCIGGKCEQCAAQGPVGWIYEDDEGRMIFSQMPHPDPLWEPVFRAAPKAKDA